MQLLGMRSRRTSCIVCWNVIGEFRRPNGSLFHVYWPLRVTKEALCLVYRSNQICQNPDARSSTEKYWGLVPPMRSQTSLRFGIASRSDCWGAGSRRRNGTYRLSSWPWPPLSAILSEKVLLSHASGAVRSVSQSRVAFLELCDYNS